MKKNKYITDKLIPAEIRDEVKVLSSVQMPAYAYWNKYEDCEFCSNIRFEVEYKAKKLWINLYHGIGYRDSETKDKIIASEEPLDMDTDLYYCEQDGDNKTANELQSILDSYYFNYDYKNGCLYEDDSCFIENGAFNLEELQCITFKKKINRSNVTSEDIKEVERFLREVKEIYNNSRIA